MQDFPVQYAQLVETLLSELQGIAKSLTRSRMFHFITPSIFQPQPLVVSLALLDSGCGHDHVKAAPYLRVHAGIRPATDR
jgi:hypothetical protein